MDYKFDIVQRPAFKHRDTDTVAQIHTEKTEDSDIAVDILTMAVHKCAGKEFINSLTLLLLRH